MDKKEEKPIKHAGKGDSPRNIFSRNYKDNYEDINWSVDKKKRGKRKSSKTTYKY